MHDGAATPAPAGSPRPQAAPWEPRPGRLGVLGWPVAHSRSPAMHRAAFAALGLVGWSYQRLPVPPELFEETVRALPGAGFVGANVTLPHKQLALALADSASVSAREIGAANTLSFSRDGAIHAENTDAPGLIAALAADPALAERSSRRTPGTPQTGAQLAGKTALVLGAGGTARSAVWALRNAGASVTIWNRTAERARELAADFGVSAVDRVGPADLLLNCTTVGLDEGASNSRDTLQLIGLSADLISGYAHIVDYVYGRRETSLLAAARERGVMTTDGIAILLEQGALSFELWTGHGAPREQMRAALAREADR